ncbi:MAG: CHAT domain-containing protein [Bacteroidaceae bacterium]|nr:CHAT domain-containing protein [Bacteroidaceae bacterium]
MKHSTRLFKSFCLLLAFLLAAPFIYAQDEKEKEKKIEELVLLSQQARQRGDIAEAIRLCDEEISLRQAMKQPFDLIGNAVHNQATNYSLLLDYDKAIQTEQQALVLYQKMKSSRENDLAVSLFNLSTYHYSRGHVGDLDQAIQYAEQVLNTGNRKIAVRAMNQLIAYYTQAGQNDQAAVLSKDILKMGRKAFGEHSAEYADILSTQAKHLSKTGHLQQAIQYATQSIVICEHSGDTLNLPFARYLMTAAGLYAARENYRQSLQQFQRAQSLLLQLEGPGGINYTHCTSELSFVYAQMGDLEKSNDLAVHIRQSKDDTTLQNAFSLTKQAQIHATNGDYPHAIPLQLQAIEIFALNKDSVGMANANIELSRYYNRNHQTDQAILTCQQAIDYLQSRSDQAEMLARAYNNMAIFSRAQGNTAGVQDFSEKAVQYYETAADTLNTQYATILGNLSTFCFDQGQTAEAINYSLRSHHILQQLLGNDHPDNVLTLLNLANFYYQQGDMHHCYHYYDEALHLQTRIVQDNFTHMTTNGREAYWNTKKPLYTQAPVFSYHAQPTDTTILIDTYNAQLFTKGILLNSEIDFKTLLLRSGNQQLLDQYSRLSSLNDTIELLYNAATPETAAKADSLHQLAVILERDLMRNSKEYGDYTANMHITAATIARNLREEDVAVELFEVPTADGGTSYFAMYLRKDWHTPRLVTLFGTAQLEAFRQDGQDFFQLIRRKEGINYIFNNAQLGQLVWHPLQKAWENDTLLAPVQNIYFSPTGIFYKWGIEYLQMDEAHRIGDLYNIYRLSSTKQLAHRTEEKPIRHATIFGGINYDLTIAEMQELHHNNPIDYKATYMTYDVDLDRNVDKNVSDTRDLADFSDWDEWEGTRAGISYLQGTYDEAQLIGEQLMQHNIPTNMVLHHEATEENFKALSGSGQSLVHIATHGFSFPEGSKSRRALAYLFGKTPGTPAYNNSMHYSGLLFAGAANIFNHHQRIPADIEDGVLTAAEISALDLRDLDLVVLSACQTGLGDVKDDGVFGLQRGFKKAGAHTLLMSLWSVNDQTTQLMMTSFYIALVQGDSRHEAFRKAQQTVRDSGHKEPYYWACFIMLDDI